MLDQTLLRQKENVIILVMSLTAGFLLDHSVGTF